MKARLAAVAALALLAVGCGGKAAPVENAASLVPADALAYATAGTNLHSGALRSARDVLDKFPVRDEVVREIASLAPAEALGPQLDAAVLNVGRRQVVVGFTQPADPKAFDAQLPRKTARATKGGWAVFSESQAAVDAVMHAKQSLADEPEYQAAARLTPATSDTVGRAYVARAGIRTLVRQAATPLASFGTAQWLAVKLTSSRGALQLELHAKGIASPVRRQPVAASLADQIPSGAIVALHLAGAAEYPEQQVAALSRTLGIDVDALLDALGGPAIAYVRPAIPFPEVTIAARPAHPKPAA